MDFSSATRTFQNLSTTLWLKNSPFKSTQRFRYEGSKLCFFMFLYYSFVLLLLVLKKLLFHDLHFISQLVFLCFQLHLLSGWAQNSFAAPQQGKVLWSARGKMQNNEFSHWLLPWSYHIIHVNIRRAWWLLAISFQPINVNQDKIKVSIICMKKVLSWCNESEQKKTKNMFSHIICLFWSPNIDKVQTPETNVDGHQHHPRP